MHTYQAVILVGGASTELYPLTAGGIPKVLLPIANETLLSFSLRTLEESGIQNVILVRSLLQLDSDCRSRKPMHLPLGAQTAGVCGRARGC